MAKGQVHIGTSGWDYAAWKGKFYPDTVPSGQLLPEYAKSFATVEINRSFYRLPTHRALVTWREQTPDDFIFACKASRYLTHRKKLKDPDEPVNRLMRTLEPLENKLGPILFQLPPNWRVNPERLEVLLQRLPAGHRYTFELRDQSWLREDIYELLEQHNAALCFYDFKGFRSPEIVTADFVYVRLHGPNEQPYWGAYDGRSLSAYARKMKRWTQAGKDVYCYFDNDWEACAPNDAKRLLDKLDR